MRSERREAAYSAVDRERAYQDVRWEQQKTDVPSIDAFACYVAGYTAKLVDACSITDDRTKRLEIFRKIAALCIACMERHGSPFRGDET